MSDRPVDAWIDEFERDLGQTAVLSLLAAAGGQRRAVPKSPIGSRLAREIGEDAAAWMSNRFGGTEVDIPSLRGRQQQDGAAALRAAILEAGLTDPRRSANVLAAEHGVRVRKLRTKMRAEYAVEPMLPLFDLCEIPETASPGRRRR